MKKLFIFGEGIADLPSRMFDDRTPLELARTPNLDRMALGGCTGLCKTIPSGSEPGSDIGFLSLTGNKPSAVLGSKGYFEAKGLGLDLTPDRTAFRCNLIIEKDGNVMSYGCRSISDDECVVLANSLNKITQDLPIQFYPVSGYRMIMVAENQWLFEGKKNNLYTYSPKSGGKFGIQDHLPSGNGSDKLIGIMQKAADMLSSHEINQVKIDLGESPANALWLWGQSVPTKIKTFQELYNTSGICVPGTHLIRGISICAGLEAMPVVNAHSKNGYEIFPKRVDSIISALELSDFVVAHIETINDISQDGDLQKKCQCIESFDEKVVGRLLSQLQSMGEFRMLVASSHVMSLEKASIEKGPVPWVLYGTGVKPDKSRCFNEREARSARFSVVAGHKLLYKTLFKK